MAEGGTTVDSLNISISATADNASKSLDNLVKRLGLVAEGISVIGKNSGLEEFAKKAQEATKGFAEIQNVGKSLSANIEPQIKKVSKTLEQITAQYANLGKGFTFKGSTADIQKQIDKYTNSLEAAKLKKEELEAAGKTDGAMYEAAVAKTVEYKNVIESLKTQLEEMQAVQPQINIKIHGLEETQQAVEQVRESVNIPESALNYNADAMIATFGEAAGNIKNWQQAVEQFGERAGQILNNSTQLDINISGLEEAQQNLNSLSGQLQNMKNLITQSFADLKSGDIFRYLSASAGEFVKKAQLASGIKVYTEDYKTLQGDIDRAEQALEKLQQKQRDLEATGTSTESAEWQKVATQITAAQSRLDSYINRRHEMESSGADVQFSGGLANQSMIKNVGAVAGEAMASLRQRIGEIGGTVSQAIGNIPIIGRVAKESAFLGKSAFEGFKLALSGVAKAASTAVSAVSKIASVVSRLVSGIKGAISNLSKMAKSFIGLKGASKGMNVSLAGGFKTVLKYAFGIRSLYVLINKLRTAMKEGFKNLAQYSTETNKSISMLQSSLGALKNSLAVAFAPILNVIAPALSAFIDMLTKAFNTVGQFFAALTGQSFAAQAKKNFTDYADSVSEAGGATKKAGKDVQKSLRAFDELNVIYTNQEEESGGGGGGGEISPADMFETVPIDSKVSDFVQKIKDAWANADFTEIGANLGAKLKAALDGIEWEPIKETAAKIGKSIGTLINGFVEVDGLGDSIGRTIGEAINTGIAGINAFLDNTHWDSVGKFIGDGLNGIVNTVDWAGLGHLFAAKFNAIFETLGNIATTFDWSNFGLQLATSVNTFITDFNWAENGAHFGELIKGLLDTIISFLENTNWQELGNGIADFIGSIDWSGIATRLAEGIGAALGGLAALLWGLIEDAWNSVVEWWNETAFEDGQFTMSGLLNGIWEGIKNIGTWINDHIFKPFIDGFKKAFGIASPSKVMEEQGGFIMEGLLGGISSLVQSVVDVFNKIKEKIVGIWGAIKTKTSEVWNSIKTFVSDLWTGLKTNVSNVFGSIKTTITNIWNGIKTVTTNIWNGIKNAIKTPINAIIGFINGLVSGVVKGMNGMINAMNKLSFDVPDWVPSIGGKTFGFNIPNITAPQIPLLANGAVLKGGNPFLAVLNDQKRGQTNIEAPLKVIQEALREELQKFTVNFNGMMLNRKAFDYQLVPAPAPNFAGAYGNYRYDTSAYTGINSNNSSEMSNVIESAVYRATYNAVSAAMQNSPVNVDFQVEGDPNGIFKVVRDKDREFFRRTGRGAFTF